MISLDDLLKDTFDEDATTVPPDDMLAARVTTRARQDIRRARLRAVLVAAALVVLAGWPLTQLVRSAPPALTPGITTSPFPKPPPDPSHPVQTYDDYLAELAEWAGITEPVDVGMVHIFENGFEQRAMTESCMSEAGYSGMDHVFSTEAEHRQFAHAMYVCQSEYRTDDRLYGPRTPTQIAFIRQFWIDSAIPCLHNLGYEIAQPPGVETVIELWNQPGAYRLEGAVSTVIRAETELIEAVRTCPLMPPLDDIMEH